MSTEIPEGHCSCGRHHSDQCDLCQLLTNGVVAISADDPEVAAEQACESAINALDQLMQIAANKETARFVLADERFINQILFRSQLLATFLETSKPQLRIVSR